MYCYLLLFQWKWSIFYKDTYGSMHISAIMIILLLKCRCSSVGDPIEEGHVEKCVPPWWQMSNHCTAEAPSWKYCFWLLPLSSCQERLCRTSCPKLEFLHHHFYEQLRSNMFMICYKVGSNAFLYHPSLSFFLFFLSNYNSFNMLQKIIPIFLNAYIPITLSKI